MGALFHGLGFVTNPIQLFTNYPPKYRNEGLDRCPGVCAVAARLAAEELYKIRGEG